MKYTFFVFVIAIIVAFAKASPVVEAAKKETGLNWNPEARITLDIIKNATLATQQNRLLTKNGTIGHEVGAVLINGTWQLPANNSAVAAAVAAAANNTAELNLGTVPGCNLDVPTDYTVDKIVGEWCSSDIKKGGFLFRGLRDKTGKLFLQRFTFKNHKSLNTTLTSTNSTNSTNATFSVSSNPAVANLFSLSEATEDNDEVSDEVSIDSMIESALEENDVLDVDVDEDEVFFIELDSQQDPIVLAAAPFVDPMVSSVPPPPPPPTETVGKDHLLKTLKNGYTLPDIGLIKPLTRCHNIIKEYNTCESTQKMIALNGTEHKGFCATPQDSAKLALDFEAHLPTLTIHKRLLQHVAVAGSSAFDTWKNTEKLNDNDQVGMCFKPGSVVEQDRYNVKGGFKSVKLGFSSGYFKPTLQVRCDSVYCKYNYVKKINFYDFQP